jgi:hypothetical protein
MSKKIFYFLILNTVLILYGCKEKTNNNKLKDSKLLVSNGYNEIKNIQILSINKNGISIIDTIKISDFERNLNFENKNYKNQLIDKYLISTNGIFVNLKTNEILKDSTNNKIIDSNLFIKYSNDTIFTYNVEKKNIYSFDLKNKFTKHHNIDFNLQKINSIPQTSFISPNLNYVIEFSDMKQMKNSNFYNNSVEIIVKNLKTGKTKVIDKQVFTPSLNILSSSDTFPLILWIDNENFFFTNFTNQNKLQDCEIYKYNINTNGKKLISKIKSLPIENYTPKFENDFSNKTFFKFGTILKEINNPDKKTTKFDLGNNFYLTIKKNSFYLHDAETEIKKINLSNNILFNPFNKNHIISSKSSIAIIIDEEDNHAIWKKELYIYNRLNKKWNGFKINELTGIIGFQE